MKKQIVLGLGLAVMATPALASKARLLALGEDANGSFYINDNRNIFLNASEVNNHKDLVTMEWGAADAAGAANTPNAEGGLFRSYNNMVYGVQFGRNVSFNEANSLLNNGGNTVGVTNALDVFVGGDAGVKWGAQLTYGARKDSGADDNETQVIDLAAGATAGDISAFVKAGVKGLAESGAEEVKRKSDYTVGASYKMGNYTAFGAYSMAKYEADLVTDDGGESKDLTVGVGGNHKVNDKATIFSKLSYVNSTVDQDTAHIDHSVAVPLVLGLEYDAASWVTLRGSISQELHSSVDDGTVRGTNAETTTVAAGASLKFGELNIDGMIGNNNNGNNAGIGAEDTSGGNGQLRTDSLMSRVSMTYRF